MKPNPFIQRVREIENQYGSFDNVPDDVYEEFEAFRKHYFNTTVNEGRENRRRIHRHSNLYRIAMLEAYEKLDTKSMHLDEIMHALNEDPVVTHDGEFPLDLASVQSSLNHRGLRYIHTADDNISNRSALGGYIK